MSRTTPDRIRERTDWLERAESVSDAINAHADASTQARSMTAELLQVLESVDAFAMASPREVCGFDVHPATQVEVFEHLASIDVSSGWVAMIQAETAGMVGSHLNDGVALDAVFGEPFPRVAGTANPQGVATPLADGAFRLNGRWSFASGIQHCGWVLANAVVLREDGSRPDPHSSIPPIVGCVVEQSRLEVEDSWHVMGLEGTGSCHYQAHDVVVEAPYITPFGGRHANRGGPWFYLPTITFLSPGHTGIALGSARRALQLLSSEITERTRMGSTSAIADRGAFQRDVGEHYCRYEAARAYALTTLDEAMARCEAGGEIADDHDAHIRGMVTWVTDACLDIVRFAHHNGGGAAAFLDHPLQRLLRDLTVASQHIYVADSAYEQSGAFRLGRRPANVF